MPISDTTAKDFENLISYLNSSWNVLSDWHGQFLLYFHSFTPKNGCKVGQYFKNCSIVKLISLEPFNCFYIFFCIKIEYHKTFKMMVSLSWKNTYLTQKRTKRVKSGWGSWKKNIFCILLKIGSLDFFNILHKVRGH